MVSKRLKLSGNGEDSPYMCNCKKYCHGKWTSLSRSTYYDHKKCRMKTIEFISVDDGEDSNDPTHNDSLAQEGFYDVDQYSQQGLQSTQLYRDRENISSGSNMELYNSDSRETFFSNDDSEATRANFNECNSVRDEPKYDECSDEENLYDIANLNHQRPHSRTSHTSGDSETPLDEIGGIFYHGSHHGSISPENTNLQSLEDGLLEMKPQVPELKIAMEFIRELRMATLESSGLSPSQIRQLRNPQSLSFNQDEHEMFSLKQFIATINCPEKVYRSISQNHTAQYPDNPMLSFDTIRNKLRDWSGVYGVSINMCINSCMAFTGPFKNLDKCNFCGSPQYHPYLRNGTRKPLRHFYSMPIGPQVQVLWKSVETAEKMHYRRNRTKEIIEGLHLTDGEITKYEDILHGTEYLQAITRGDISSNDTVIMFAMDGAQLYQSKESDCWIFIFTLLELPPEFRFLKKHVMIASCVPGPHKPRQFDSFLFPIFEHISAVNNDGGLKIWDASMNTTFCSKLFFFLNTADRPGSIYFTGLVGHHGTFPCRLFCGLKGRHKPGIPHYYPALLLPENYEVGYCAHADVNVNQYGLYASDIYYKHLETILNATCQTNYKSRRKTAGISKPPLILGLGSRTRLPLYAGLSGDAMHVTTLNLGDLLLPLWRGTFARDKTDHISNWDWAVFRDIALWHEHGKRVESCKPYIPSSFDRPPRNLAEKMNSGYKAKEWQNYFQGLAPALLFHILPFPYWQNFCKLIRAIQLCMQYNITTADLLYSQKLLNEFVVEFEESYIQRRADRIHFACPCIHAIWHLGLEIARLGPSCLYAAWTIERTIGNLGEEIRSESKPYANLVERCLLQCQINALKIANPTLELPLTLPSTSINLGNNFILLGARDPTPRFLEPQFFQRVKNYLESNGFYFHPAFHWKFIRWARLLLPNGQIARCAWKELTCKYQNLRCARNIKFVANGQTRFGEVQFYLHVKKKDENYCFAVVRLYSPHDINLYQISFGTIICVQNEDDDEAIQMIPVQDILSVVSIQPWHEHNPNSFFVWEKTGIALSMVDKVTEDGTED